MITKGQKLVGFREGHYTTNGLSVKTDMLCADLIDVVTAEYSKAEWSDTEQIVFDHTIGEILSARNAVAALLKRIQ